MDYLKEIYTEDIDLLIQDLEFIKNGYEINYIIDAGAVFDYTFPYGIYFGKINKLSIDDIGDQSIAYEYIFKNYKPIILNEYKLELILNRNHIRENKDSRLNNDLLTNVIKSYNNIDEIDDEISKSATFMLTTAFMQKPMINFFDDIFYNKLQIDSLHLKSGIKNDERIIFDIFGNNKRSQWSIESFYKWVDKFQNSKKEDSENIKKVFKSTLRDYIVIDRICTSNSLIQKNKELKGKYLFLYFSGAKKSNTIFKTKEVINHLPTIDNNKNYNILRTPKHSYLLFLIQNSDTDKMIESMKLLRKISKNKENQIDLLSNLKSNSLSNKDRTLLENINSKRREILEYVKIKKQINEHISFQRKLEERITKLKNTENLDELVENFNHLLSEAKKSNEDISEIEMEISYLLQGRLFNLIKTFSDKESYLINKGNDLINGSYHHLPILLFLKKTANIDKELDTFFYKTLNFVIQPINLRQQNLKDFINSVKEIFYKIEKRNKNETYYDMLLKIFILLIIEKNNNFIKSDALIILKDSYDMLCVSSKAREKWESDYLYMLIWLSRRIKKFEETIYYCDLGIKKYPDDPRFYHGKSLYLYNVYFRKKSLTSCTKKQLSEIIEYTEKSISLYKNIINDELHYKKQFSTYIKGNISALKNLLLYSISIYYLNNLEQNKQIVDFLLEKYSLNYLRNNLLFYMKTFEKEIGNKNKGFAEYCHTESILELVEGISTNNIEKLDMALDAINCTISIDKESNLYKITKIKILNWQSKLK